MDRFEELQDQFEKADNKAFRNRFHGRGFECCSSDNCRANTKVAKKGGFRPYVGVKPKSSK